VSVIRLCLPLFEIKKTALIKSERFCFFKDRRSLRRYFVFLAAFFLVAFFLATFFFAAVFAIALKDFS
jgi:hypothetical protein